MCGPHPGRQLVLTVQGNRGICSAPLTRAEWEAFTAAMDPDGDGEPEREGVVAVMGGMAEDWRLFLLAFDQDADGDFDAVDLEMTFADQDFDGDGTLRGKEMMGWAPTGDFRRQEAPAPGSAAPDFTLGYADGSGDFTLQDPERARPVALIFGSYT